MQKELNFRTWKNWTKSDWEDFDYTVAEAKAAATAIPSDPLPAATLFLEIRDNIRTLPVERRFSMGNTADDLTQAIQKGLSGDLFAIQKNCPYIPRRVETSPPPLKAYSDKNIGRQPHEEYVELDFEHWEHWGAERWKAFTSEVHGTLKTPSPAHLALIWQMIQAINKNIDRLPEQRQREALKLAEELITACQAATEQVARSIRRKKRQLRKRSPQRAVFKVTIREHDDSHKHK